MELPEVVKRINPYLSLPLDDKKLIELIGLRAELAESIRVAQQSLYEKRRQMLWPKDKDYTELDRKTRLEGDTAVYQANYDFLLKLDEIVALKAELSGTGRSGS